MQARYMVSAYQSGRDMLVEIRTDDVLFAAEAWDWLQCSDWNVRVFDQTDNVFVRPNVLQLLNKFWS